MLRFIRHLLCLLGAVHGLVHFPAEETEGQSAMPPQEGEVGTRMPGRGAGNGGLESAHDLA